MKKTISVFLAAALALTLAACGAKENGGTNLKISGENSAPAAVDITSPVKAKADGAVLTEGGDLSMRSPYKTEAEKYEASTEVIRGRVISSEYVLERAATVFTKSTVEILQSYKGSLAAGDIIQVREMGGFIPNDVYVKAIHKEKFGEDLKGEISTEILDKRFYGAKVMEKDEEVILYLSKIPKDAKLEEEYGDNCYGLLRVWQGKLLYNEEYDAYIPFVPEEELAPKSECENISAKYAPARYGTLKNGIQPRIFTLEEFNAFAEEMNAHNR